MDLTERYLQRSELLLRLINPDDLGHLVDPEARREICRVLHLDAPSSERPCAVINESQREAA